MVHTRFTAGTRTTSRVGSEHKQYKSLKLGPSILLNDVFVKLNKRTQAETAQNWERRNADKVLDLTVRPGKRSEYI